MMMYPLAIYTAWHGLEWIYPKSEIDYGVLDDCRKVFDIPQFDAGECGYVGVWVRGKYVFAIRCQSVSNWDFRGRDAVYLTVTWVTRLEAAQTDFEALLQAPALCKPNKDPVLFFDAACHATPTLNGFENATRIPDFSSVRGIVARLGPQDEARFIRRENESQVSVYITYAPKPVSHKPEIPLPSDSKVHQQSVNKIVKHHNSFISLPPAMVIVFCVILCISLILNVFLFLMLFMDRMMCAPSDRSIPFDNMTVDPWVQEKKYCLDMGNQSISKSPNKSIALETNQSIVVHSSTDTSVSTEDGSKKVKEVCTKKPCSYMENQSKSDGVHSSKTDSVSTNLFQHSDTTNKPSSTVSHDGVRMEPRNTRKAAGD